jgi:GDP-L-fucose synthase
MLSHVNVGTGKLVFDNSKPDGAPRKLMDVSRLKALGWQASISLKKGLGCTYQWSLEHQEQQRS